MSGQTEQFPNRDMNPGAGGVILMPYLPLPLTHGKQSVSAEGLVDSGSTVSVLPYETGLKLGFVWDQQTLKVPLVGSLAAAEARGVNLTASVSGFPPVSLVFAWTQVVAVPLILGQLSFFLEFDVCFFRNRAVFEITRRERT